ncbi:uncharacterized protein LOC124134022 isoform X2 [Haliotis rufescens]|uniref:uncharacterized protein LOC124134022 isoform X2 n=1 Tax=Haliotis rufescens TaxID=6454 RepID=UPI00201F2DD8|nr:uncharacterized protein LOC124134022 isoform X2 [Haliotis rufescens]
MLSSDIVHVFVVGIFLVDITVAVPPQGGTPCADHISNCQDFKGWGCGGQYQQWAHMKCAKTCGYCDNNGFVIPYTSHQCDDKISNCKDYGLNVCSSYKDWSKVNCASMCNICDV